MTAEKVSEMQHIPLKAAYLCSDCETVGNCANRCPACACESVMSLANVLNRKDYKPEAVTK